MNYESIARKLDEIATELRSASDAPVSPTTAAPASPTTSFTEGDLVRYVGKAAQSFERNPTKGHVGVIRKISSSHVPETSILVEWESPWKGHDGRNAWIRRPGAGWWVLPSQLEPA